MPIGSQFVNQPSWTHDTVHPDKVVIDGLKFEFNHPNQTQQMIDALDGLVDSEDAAYDDIGEDLRQWKVAKRVKRAQFFQSYVATTVGIGDRMADLVDRYSGIL
ncbi:hypothetical protein MMC22_008494 [Lobaria immixta]|nr:hypothetical protein [Lobaria immixta]